MAVFTCFFDFCLQRTKYFAINKKKWELDQNQILSNIRKEDAKRYPRFYFFPSQAGLLVKILLPIIICFLCVGVAIVLLWAVWHKGVVLLRLSQKVLSYNLLLYNYLACFLAVSGGTLRLCLW